MEDIVYGGFVALAYVGALRDCVINNHRSGHSRASLNVLRMRTEYRSS